MQIIYSEEKQKYEVYKYKKKISDEEMIRRQKEFYEFDASLEAWNSLYIKVYSEVQIFNENFDFTQPEEIRNRIVIPAKKNSTLLLKYRELWMQEGIPGEPGGFYISGDCDYKYDGILENDRHKLINLSLMPVTGGLNNEKGSRESVNDVFSNYIKNLPKLIDEPNSVTGRYGILNNHKKEIVKCARKAYFMLFDEKIENYFYNVSFWGINDYKTNDEEELFKKVQVLLKYILEEENINENELAERYWNLRKEILYKKYNMNI